MSIPKLWYVPFKFENMTLLFLSVESPERLKNPVVKIRIDDNMKVSQCPKIRIPKKGISISTIDYAKIRIDDVKLLRLFVFIKNNRESILKHFNMNISDSELIAELKNNILE